MTKLKNSFVSCFPEGININMPQQKTIALVANTSWSIYNFRLGLIRHFKSLGYRIVVIAPKDSFTSKLIKEEIDYREINILNYGTNIWQELTLINTLIKLYSEIRPNLIFHYNIKPNIYGSIAAAYCRIPSIIITTGLGHLFEFKNILVRNITVGLYRIAAGLCKEIWFLNSNDQDVFIYKRIARKNKIKLLNGEGIDTEWFNPQSTKKEDGTTKFLFAGRLLKDKGIREYFEAAKYFTSNNYPCVFKVLGFIDQSNPNSIPYEEIIKMQDLKIIKYEGETTDVRPFLSEADCLVFPSYYREGISRILMEASAMETPIITSDNVGCREIVDHNITGYLCEPKDTNSLISMIHNFLKLDTQDRIVMGKLGRKKMQRLFDEKLILKEYQKTVEKYIGLPLKKEKLTAEL
jgi:glycosyltransferase involved in cell wall biosynthesis